MFPRIVILALGFMLVAGLSTPQLQSQDPPNKAEAKPDFEGQYLDVIMKTPTVMNGLSFTTHYPLQKVQKKALGDQWFLVGEGIDVPGLQKWYAGATIWLAVNDVSGIHVFPSLEKLKASLMPPAGKKAEEPQ
ncbi:MAG TPA: hypothetical protein VGZ47_22155 [Gemmataceae bacterium]|jgi:hypothetical protein|nr:hypothetical protein [Gemmataceae bacterium]